MEKIKEAIIVEGRDDTAAVKRAFDADTIETHGFGIRKCTWELIEKAYKERGIIIFTDPDYSGERIREMISAQFPDAAHAYLTRGEAEKAGDIGIENADPQAITEAVHKAHCTVIHDCGKIFDKTDMIKNRLSGNPEAASRREKLGRILGIGYGNSKSFLDRMNRYGISREEFEKALNRIEQI